MSKELKTLNEIKNHKIKAELNIKFANGDETQHKFETIGDMFPQEFNILETALKNYEELNKDYSVVVKEKIDLCVMYAKEHRIVGIIKNKGIDILKLKECEKCKTPDEYNKRTCYSYHKCLTQEEFDLVKEVLL